MEWNINFAFLKIVGSHEQFCYGCFGSFIDGFWVFTVSPTVMLLKKHPILVSFVAHIMLNQLFLKGGRCCYHLLSSKMVQFLFEWISEVGGCEQLLLSLSQRCFTDSFSLPSKKEKEFLAFKQRLQTGNGFCIWAHWKDVWITPPLSPLKKAVACEHQVRLCCFWITLWPL